MTAQSIVYFGDSLTDNGNLYAYGEGILPDDIRDSLVGPTQAVSDGPTHAAHTGDILGLDEVNYAVAAAEATGSQTLEDLIVESGFEDDLLVPIDDPALDLDINLDAQIDRFADDFSGADLSQTAGFILIGGNDFQNLDFTSPTVVDDALALIDDIIAAEVDAALDLFAAGMGTVWLSELPVAEFFAGTADYSAFERAAAQLAFDTFNASLAEAVAELAGSGLDARLAETTLVTEAIAEDPTGFGLLAPYADTILYSDATDTFDNDQIAFYDDIHPSTATHGVIGAFNALVFSGGAATAGNAGADMLSLATSMTADSVAFGLAGDDAITAAGCGTAIAFGGTGNDTLAGVGGNDLLSGGEGDDVLDGHRGDDVLAGGLGNDIMRGMIGADVLIDSLGDDMLRGGLDDDIFIFTEASLLGGTDNGLNVFVGGAGFDTLYLVLDRPGGAVAADLLDDLGLRVKAIEEIVVLDGREALDVFDGQAWYDPADVWGLI